MPLQALLTLPRVRWRAPRFSTITQAPACATFSDRRLQALAIARAGTAGVSLDQLRKVIGSSRETVESMLRALVRARQVVVVKVGGELVYRVTM
jgi:predicted transcriptional regulator